jgi:hypothetical protein
MINFQKKLREGMEASIKPFTGIVQDTANNNIHIRVEVRFGKIIQEDRQVELELIYTLIKTKVWYKASIFGSTSVLEQGTALFFHWNLLKGVLGNYIDQEKTEEEGCIYINPSSLDYNFPADRLRKIEGIMKLCLEYFISNAQIVPTIIGHRIETLDINGRALYLLKRLYQQKNKKLIAKVKELARLPEDDYLFTPFLDYSWIHFGYPSKSSQDNNESYSMNDRSVTSPASLRHVRSRRKAHKVNFTININGNLQLVSPRRGEQFSNSPGKYSFKSDEGENSSWYEWDELLSHTEVTNTKNRVIDAMRPIAIEVILYNNDYYICVLKIEVAEGNTLRKANTSPRRQRGFRQGVIAHDAATFFDTQVYNRSCSIDKFVMAFSIYGREAEKIYSHKINMRQIGEFLDVSESEIILYIIKKVTRSIVNRQLRKKIHTRIVEHAGK